MALCLGRAGAIFLLYRNRRQPVAHIRSGILQLLLETVQRLFAQYSVLLFMD